MKPKRCPRTSCSRRSRPCQTSIRQPDTDAAQFRDNVTNASLEQCQRDDLESLGYTLVFLHKGTLPWDREGFDEIKYLKENTPPETLFKGMDPAFLAFFKEVRLLKWGQVPDYNGMKNRFHESWESREFEGRPGEIDWSSIYEDLEAEKTPTMNSRSL